MNEQECRILLSKFSHEVRNPVTLINSFLQLLTREYPEITSYPFYKKIAENMVLLMNLLDEMSRFNNAPKLHREEIHLQAFLSELADSGNSVFFSQNIHIALNIPSDLPNIHADQTKLLQVFHNLIRNAAEAMPNGGTSVSGQPSTVRACRFMLRTTVRRFLQNTFRIFLSPS